MALNTYSALQTTIANYLSRDDLTAAIPDFIQLAEIRLRRDLRLRQMLTQTSTAATGGVATISLPTDFLQARDVYVDSDPDFPITFATPSIFIRNGRTNESGVPAFYTILGSTIQLAPIPDSNYTIKILYYAAPDFLSTSNTTNLFLTTCPDALLYGALGEAEPYLMNDPRLQTWGVLYDRAIAALTRSDEESQYSGVPLAMALAKR
jgi:hypothetical protein